MLRLIKFFTKVTFLYVCSFLQLTREINKSGLLAWPVWPGFDPFVEFGLPPSLFPPPPSPSSLLPVLPSHDAYTYISHYCLLHFLFDTDSSRQRFVSSPWWSGLSWRTPSGKSSTGFLKLFATSVLTPNSASPVVGFSTRLSCLLFFLKKKLLLMFMLCNV